MRAKSAVLGDCRTWITGEVFVRTGGLFVLWLPGWRLRGVVGCGEGSKGLQRGLRDRDRGCRFGGGEGVGLCFH